MIKHPLYVIMLIFMVHSHTLQSMDNGNNERPHEQADTESGYGSDWLLNELSIPLSSLFEEFETPPNTPISSSPSVSPSTNSQRSLSAIRKHFFSFHDDAINVKALQDDYCLLSPDQQNEADKLLAFLARDHLNNKPLLTFLRKYKIINTPANLDGNSLLLHAAIEGEYKNISALLLYGADPLQVNDRTHDCALKLLMQKATSLKECSPEMKAWMECVSAALMQQRASRQNIML